MTTGEKIRRLRKDHGMTQEDLGNKIGVQKAAINKYETGIVVNLKRDVLQKIANVFDVSPIWLMDDDFNWPPFKYRLNLFGSSENTSDDSPYKTQTDEAHILAEGIDKMPKEDRERALAVVLAMFANHSEYFKKGNNSDDA